MKSLITILFAFVVYYEFSNYEKLIIGDWKLCNAQVDGIDVFQNGISNNVFKYYENGEHVQIRNVGSDTTITTYSWSINSDTLAINKNGHKQQFIINKLTLDTLRLNVVDMALTATYVKIKHGANKK